MPARDNTVEGVLKAGSLEIRMSNTVECDSVSTEDDPARK